MKKSRLTSEQIKFLKAIAGRYVVSSNDLAVVLDVTPRAARYRLRQAKDRKTQGTVIGVSALRHSWRLFQEHGELGGSSMVFSPGDGQPGQRINDGLKNWLEDVVGWHSLSYIGKKLKRKRPALRWLLKELNLWDKVYRFSCRNLSKIISDELNYHLPASKLADLCRQGTLRWYKEGKAMVIKPHDAQWFLDHWRPGMVIPRHPGQGRWE